MALNIRVLRLKLAQQFGHCLFALLGRAGEVHFSPSSHVVGQNQVYKGIELGPGQGTLILRTLRGTSQSAFSSNHTLRTARFFIGMIALYPQRLSILNDMISVGKGAQLQALRYAGSN